jgi:hypothetical protein
MTRGSRSRIRGFWYHAPGFDLTDVRNCLGELTFRALGRCFGRGGIWWDLVGNSNILVSSRHADFNRSRLAPGVSGPLSVVRCTELEEALWLPTTAAHNAWRPAFEAWDLSSRNPARETPATLRHLRHLRHWVARSRDDRGRQKIDGSLVPFAFHRKCPAQRQTWIGFACWTCSYNHVTEWYRMVLKPSIPSR